MAQVADELVQHRALGGDRRHCYTVGTMLFEYIGGVASGHAGADWTTEESFVSAVATAVQRQTIGRDPVKTIHGEFRVSCRPLSAAEMAHLGLSPQMRAESRFAVHIEGRWHTGSGEAADVVLELHAAHATSGANPARAYLHSSATCIDLPEHEVGRIKQELLSALQLLG